MSIDVRQRRGEATRSEILSVARRLFADFGYHNTGISDIQSATGLTKGAFYHHFRSKQELGLAVVEAAWEDYGRQVLKSANMQASAGRRLSSLLDSIVALNGQPEWQNCRLLATLCAGLTAADGVLADSVRDVQEQLLSAVIGMIADAQQAGEAASGSPEAWAQLLIGSLMGMVLIRKIGVGEADLAAVVKQLKMVLLPGVVGGDAGKG